MKNGLLVLSGAFNFPLFAIIFFSATFLALSSVTTIARERDQGTMEALFYGPIDSTAYILGKIFGSNDNLSGDGPDLRYLFCYLRPRYQFHLSLTDGAGSYSLSVLITSDVISFGIFSFRLKQQNSDGLAPFSQRRFRPSRHPIWATVAGSHSFAGRLLQPPSYFCRTGWLILTKSSVGYRLFLYLMQAMEAIRRDNQLLFLIIFVSSTLFTPCLLRA